MSFNFAPKELLAIRHLRFQRLWISLGLLMLLVVAIGSLVLLPAPVKSVMLQDKLLHTLVYACLMGWFAQIYRHDLTRLLLAIALASMGVGIEFIQGLVPYRQFELLDMVANTSGVLLAWALAYTRVGELLVRVEQFFFRLLPG